MFLWYRCLVNKLIIYHSECKKKISVPGVEDSIIEAKQNSSEFCVDRCISMYILHVFLFNLMNFLKFKIVSKYLC